MISLTEGEHVLMTIRRHWFALARHAVFLVLLFLIPLIFVSTTNMLGAGYVEGAWTPLVNFVLCLYLLALLMYGFVLWTDYYLDVWIITNERLIDIQQRGLFDRTISELGMNNVQDVTIEVRGIIATFLKFGNLTVQTASQSTFTINDAPNLYEAKELILRYSQGLNGARHDRAVSH